MTEHSRLNVQNLQKSFKKRQVVKNFSLEIESGEVVGLLGPNGAGKTTSFYMIVGLIAADAGSVMLDGREIRHLPIHERARLGLGYLPQEASIFRKMTVEQNIRAILEISLKDKSRIDAELEKLLADLNIERLRNNPAPSLSGGERRNHAGSICFRSDSSGIRSRFRFVFRAGFGSRILAPCSLVLALIRLGSC